MSVLLVTGACVGASAVATVAYHTKAPMSQMLGRTFAYGPDPTRMALTYDDGPNEPYTRQLLEVLDKYSVKATFFMVGKFVASHPQIARAVAEAGHAIGNHTYSHPNLLFTSARDLESEIEKTQAAIFDATGVTPTMFRPPFGSRRPATLRTARRLGMTPIMWSVPCGDWRQVSEEAIETRSVNKIEAARSRGHILLLHDGDYLAFGADRQRTIKVTERLLHRYGKTHRFVTIPEMMSSGEKKV